VAGERQFRARCEDPQPVVGRGLRGRQQEGRLGQVQPPGDGLHRVGVEALGVEYDRDRVAAQRLAGEHVDD
jgi:hypothetical protein